MSEKVSQTNYRDVIEENFYTSGPHIGRTKNTAATYSMALREGGMRNAIEQDEVGTGFAVPAQDARERIATRHVDMLAKYDLGHQAVAGSVELSDQDAAQHIRDDITTDYNRLEYAQQAHDAELLADARSRAIAAHEANQNAA